METPDSYHPYLERLIAVATGESRKQDLLAAKAQYFELTGDVHDDDKHFEMRMALFLNFYLYDRRSPITEKTPAQEMYGEQQRGSPPEEVVGFRALTETIHGLF